MPRDLGSLVVPPAGSLVATGEVFEPYRLVDGHGVVVAPVAAFLRDLQACGRPPGTLRSYGMDLLRWFRFVWAIGVSWDRVSSVEARDFCCWLQLADKPAGVHWRRRDGEGASTLARPARRPGLTPNPVTGKPAPGVKYAPATVAHCETVLRGFYEFCAMRRSVISPAQRGEIGGISLDPMAYLAPKGNMGTIACQKLAVMPRRTG